VSKPRQAIPLFAQPIIETHFHLDYLKHLPADELVAASLKQNVEKMITIAVSPDNLDTVISLVEKYPNVFGTQGVHPHNAKDWNADVKTKIISNLLKDKIVAVGEIGLDYHYSKSPRENQLVAFEEQLQIAIDFNLPVVVHTRDADEDTIAILKNFSPFLKRGGVIHSFTSGLALAKFAIDLNFYIGFNGIITFKNAHNVREALHLTPVENILLETDAPFLTPEPYRGVENAPYYLPFIAQRIAVEKNILVEDLLRHAYLNSKKLFGLS
jgi:TatD DNase family protein